MVLGLVVLVTLFIVAFLLSAGIERSAANGFTASAAAQQLGGTAVSLVQAQISDATTQGSQIAWTSQPGMVRTFGTDGRLSRAYKLYSAPTMIGTTIDLTTDAPPATWNTNSAMWTDLNAPVTVNGEKIFPIADPGVLKDIGSIQGLRAGSGGAGGFDIITPTIGATATAANYKLPDASAAAPGATSYQPLPMPVRWLYILQDGTMVAPQITPTVGKVTLAGETLANPVVGRVAFWTDDETAKVNVNTAGEGVFWDTPRGYSPTEVLQLAIRQPWNGEFNRYPGHPATVSLSALFPNSNYNSTTLPLDTTSQNLLADYLSLTPAYAFGGSKGGSVLLPPDSNAAAYGTSLNLMDRKAERLYTSLDELIFKMDRTSNSIVNRQALESRRFLLTAHSRAPETNLFNLPRIAVWPIQQLTDGAWLKKTNPFDRLIAFCASTKKATGGDLPYFFQRTAASTRGDLTGIPRNVQLYQYLQALTSQPIPGYGGKFDTKYGYPGERDEVLTQMFDYVRTTNLYDTLLDSSGDGAAKGTYTFTASSAGVEGTPGFGQVAPSQGPNGTLGQGRYFSLHEFLLVFIACADGNVPLSNDVSLTLPAVPAGDWKAKWVNPMLKDPYPGGPLVELVPGQKRVQLMLLPQLFNTMAGMANLNPNTTVEIKGLNQFQLNGKGLQLPSGESTQPCWSYFSGSSQQFGGGGLWSPVYEYKAMLAKGGNGLWTPGNVVPVAPSVDSYDFISAPVTVNGGTMNFTGGKITVNLYAGQGTSGTLLQSIDIDVPGGTFPTPALASADDPRFWSAFNYSDKSLYSDITWQSQYTTQTSLNLQSWGRARQRFNAAPNAFPGEPIRTDYDVIRAMVPSTDLACDYRLISGVTGNDVVNTPLFVKHPLWDTTSKLNASLLEATGRKILSGGAMVSSSIYSAAPYTGTGAVNVDATGDFDLGAGSYVKGAMANKPDEGDMFRESNSNWSGVTPDGSTAPYYAGNRQAAAYAAYFSPNRIIPSPVMFGSLPTGVKERVPWRTLLFRPLAQKEKDHKGATSPHDSLLVDLFWMPVVEPYAISDRLSTAGKINMNYQIMPFTYVDRSAPMRAVLKSERMSQITMTDAYNTKIYSGGPAAGFSSSSTEHRNVIDPDETLKQFKNRFADTARVTNGTNIFISPSEICTQYLIPKGKTTYSSDSAMAGYWDTWRQTGDNLRERSYATIYQKLTTKSNTFTVYYRAQTLKKPPGGTAGEWVEGRGATVSEYRGSTAIERFINPDAKIPDYAASASPQTEDPLDAFYKWRTVSNKQFAP